MDLKTVIDSTATLKKPRRTFTAEFKHQLIQQCQLIFVNFLNRQSHQVIQGTFDDIDIADHEKRA